MSENANKVSLVLDRNYGERVHSLIATGSVWVVDTAANRMAATEYWELEPRSERQASVTTFKYVEDDSASATCLKILNVIDLHHGKYSGGYSVLEIIGAPLGEELQSAITGLGFTKFESTADGFGASREPGSG